MRNILLFLFFLFTPVFAFTQLAEDYFTLAEEKYRSGKYPAALKYYNLAIESDSIFPADYNFFYKRGFCKMETKDIAGAIVDFTKTVELSPGLVDAFYYRGLCYQRTGEFKNAIYDYSKVIEILPSDMDSFLNRAYCKNKIRDNSGALNDYNMAVRVAPDDGITFYKRGLFKIETGDLSGACHDLSRAKQLGIWEAVEVLQEYCTY